MGNNTVGFGGSFELITPSFLKKSSELLPSRLSQITWVRFGVSFVSQLKTKIPHYFLVIFVRRKVGTVLQAVRFQIPVPRNTKQKIVCFHHFTYLRPPMMRMFPPAMTMFSSPMMLSRCHSLFSEILPMLPKKAKKKICERQSYSSLTFCI